MTAVATRNVMGRSAMTSGSYSLGPKNYKADWRNNLFVHEYGHYIQSQRMGSMYYPIVAIPSVISAGIVDPIFGIDHKRRWFEMNASRLGSKHFDEKYGKGAEGYRPNDNKFFDRDKFINGVENPFHPGKKINDHPISGAKFYVFEIIP